MAKTPPEGLVLKVFREIADVGQEELAESSGHSRSEIANWEKGRTRLHLDRLIFLGKLLGFPANVAEGLLRLLGWLYPTSEETSHPPLALSQEERRIVAGAALSLAASQAEVMAEARLQDLIAADRRQAQGLWLELRTWTIAEWKQLLEDAPQLATWALVETLCNESERAAGGDARRACSLAELACWVAKRVPGNQAWRSRILGYAMAFLGNSLRVQGDLRAAEATFSRSWELWRKGTAVGSGPFDESRLFDLEASLLRDLRQWSAALERLAHAQALCSGPEAEARILLKKASLWEQKGEPEQALEALLRAEPLVNEVKSPREMFGLRFNLAVNLCHLGHFEKAQSRLGDLQVRAVALASELDLIRVLWLKSRVIAGLGHHEEAKEALAQVLGEFRARGHVFDEALATLEMARLYLWNGQTVETRELAIQVEPVFRGLGVAPEAREAVDLFWDAARRERATLELLERAIAMLRWCSPEVHV